MSRPLPFLCSFSAPLAVLCVFHLVHPAFYLFWSFYSCCHIRFLCCNTLLCPTGSDRNQSEPVGFRSVPSWSLISDWFPTGFQLVPIRLRFQVEPTGSEADSDQNCLEWQESTGMGRNPQEWAVCVVSWYFSGLFSYIFPVLYTLSYILHRSTQNSITIYDLIWDIINILNDV